MEILEINNAINTYIIIIYGNFSQMGQENVSEIKNQSAVRGKSLLLDLHTNKLKIQKVKNK